MNRNVLAPGARVLIRDAEWLVRRVDVTSTGGRALSVTGISEIVRNREAIFLTEAEKSIEALDPAQTNIVQDSSEKYSAGMLYIESLLRQTAPSDEHLYIGNEAAMDFVPYQLDPAIQALKQPRQRILIADAVGLGKTLAAGILLSELIRRGRAQRILVLAIKSMLTQFQKEMWSRFTIPLTRLDSVGIQRIRSRIPTNHNPFYYYDKAIISIDTLKQDSEYRNYLEGAYWDVIVIDEAQNVAERRSSSSKRSKLAKLLSGRSDTLIMLSATPHDGSAKSFASLMNMLNPTAIADPENYGPDDIKGLFIRRFKKDIQSQVQSAFRERLISVSRVNASSLEEQAYDNLVGINLAKTDSRETSGKLFRTTLEKSLFSSPAACLQTINNRIKTLRKTEDPGYANDIRALEKLSIDVERIGPSDFKKYQKLVSLIRDPHSGWGWDGRNTADRIVIFTERIETLRFLREHLEKDLKLKPEQIDILHGTMPDVEQQRVVEDFGRDESKVRLLVASDVASEGINLHYLCHRMIHFDIPWSLMVFQQRNGRIDRYGQEETPTIVYLVTDSANPKIRGDVRILEVLINKDDQAVRNIGDPAAFMGVYDIDAEEQKTAEAIEKNIDPAEFEKTLQDNISNVFDPLSFLLDHTDTPTGQDATESISTMPSLFQSDYDYLKAAIRKIMSDTSLQVEFNDNGQEIEITASEEIRELFRRLPSEIWPGDNIFRLSADIPKVQKEIKRSRKDESAWPKIHYLWKLNPIMQWVNDKALAHFGRHEAPVMAVGKSLNEDEKVFLMTGLIPNRKGHPLVQRWFGIVFRDSRFDHVEEVESLFKRTGLGSNRIPNTGAAIDTQALEKLLPAAVDHARKWMTEQRNVFENRINEKLNDELKELERLKERKLDHLKKRYSGSNQIPGMVATLQEREAREIEKLFDGYFDWVQETMTTEEQAYIRVVAALV